MYCFSKIPCENLCETFPRKLRKTCKITFYLENGFLAITTIAIGTRVGVKLEGYDFESVGRPFESGRAHQIKERYKAKGARYKEKIKSLNLKPHTSHLLLSHPSQVVTAICQLPTAN